MFLSQIPFLFKDPQAISSSFVSQKNAGFLSQDQLCEAADPITVKVWRDTSWGSGTIIKRNGSKYAVATNGHILANQEWHKVNTYDGQEHQAFVLARFDNSKSTGDDLVILQFESARNYKTAQLVQWHQGERVMVAGYPVAGSSTQTRDPGFTCTKLGEVFRKLDQPMKNGYQLGYFLDTRSGMSGGPVLNNKGSVVGIHGMGLPVFINPDLYLYRDGLRVSESLGVPSEQALSWLSNSGWAIPSKKIEYLCPRGLNLMLAEDHTNLQIPLPNAQENQ